MNISESYSCLEVVRLVGGLAPARNLDLALEADIHGPQFGQLLAPVGLLGVELRQAVFGQADELGVLVDLALFGGLAADVALRQALDGEADLESMI
jgi:hypothetical protein